MLNIETTNVKQSRRHKADKTGHKTVGKALIFVPKTDNYYIFHIYIFIIFKIAFSILHNRYTFCIFFKCLTYKRSLI